MSCIIDPCYIIFKKKNDAVLYIIFYNDQSAFHCSMFDTSRGQSSHFKGETMPVHQH